MLFSNGTCCLVLIRLDLFVKTHGDIYHVVYYAALLVVVCLASVRRGYCAVTGKCGHWQGGAAGLTKRSACHVN